METVTLDVAGTPAAFELDFETDTWHSETTFAEGAFPVIAEVAGKRYELYSDGTLGEEELP
jgi:hypothetical protein